jgi:uncharacterized lipoprotein YajG
MKKVLIVLAIAILAGCAAKPSCDNSNPPTCLIPPVSVSAP